MPRKLKLPHTKTYIKEGHKLQGTWPQYVAARERYKKAGATVEHAWDKALKEFPLAAATHVRLRELRRERYRTLNAAAFSDEELAREAEKLREEMNRLNEAPAAERTGIPLVDWLYANLGRDMPSTPAPAMGDFKLWEYFKSNKAEFYNKVYIPALLKNAVPKTGDAPPPRLEASDTAARDLLELLRARNGKVPGNSEGPANGPAPPSDPGKGPIER